MEYKIARPFGPSIYVSKLTDEELLFLTDIAKKTKEANISMDTRLAGNIVLQLMAQLNTADRDTFMGIIAKHIQQCAYAFDEYKSDLFASPTADVLKFGIGEPWINFQKAGEFNPVHNHSGILSAILYIDIPEEIEKENIHNTNKPSAGNIDFISGDPGRFSPPMYMHTPKTGDVLLFPSQLMHTVYPFKSDVERISLSFNVRNLLIDDADTK
jgi:uncharacterized protein (TIGR02466 family)